MSLALTILAVAALLLVNEAWYRRQRVHDEFSRKFIHITVGSFVAFWPFWLSWTQIRFLSVAFLVVVIISKYRNVFTAIHSVTRTTWGEICFAIVVGLLTFVTHNKGIYAVAILQMSLADGLAAIIGTQYGKPTSYFVLRHRKSLAGSTAFFVVSLVILIIFSLRSAHHEPIALLPVLALAATALENIAVLGLDNLLVPLLVAVVLTNLH